MNTGLSFIGRNIRTLRRQAGLSQGELAHRIGIRTGPMSNIERGRNAPSARVLDALSRVLDVSMDRLFDRGAEAHVVQDGMSGQHPFLVERDDVSLPKRIERVAWDIMHAVFALEDLCGAPKQALIPLHAPLRRNADGMERLAGLVRETMGIGHGVVFDYFELFETCGLRVVVLSLPATLSSFAFFDPKHYNAFFFINGRVNPERQLFQLVFELGRIYLLTASLQRIAPDHQGDELDDVHAARRFAAVFLMPEEAVRSTVRQLGIQDGRWDWDLLLRIKHRFGISAEAFLYRLEELDLIEEASNRTLRKKLQQHYETTGFAEPDSTRRRLTPNGRIWDLMLTARRTIISAAEIAEIEAVLKRGRVKKV